MLEVTQTPLVSVVIPAYNAADYVEQAIASVLSQRDVSYELIVVNDGSTDETLTKAMSQLRQYQSNSTVISQPNMGEGTAVNVGVANSRGKYLCILSADDYLLPDHLITMTSVLEGAPEVVVAYPDWLQVRKDRSLIRVVCTKDYSRIALIEEFLCIPGPGAVIRRSAITDNGLRDASYRFIGDYKQWLELSERGNFVRVAKPLAAYRMHDLQVTRSGSAVAHKMEIMRLADEVVTGGICPSFCPRNWNRMRAYAYYYAACLSIKDPNVSGLALLRQSSKNLSLLRRDHAVEPRRYSVVLAILLSSASTSIHHLVNSIQRRST